MHVAVCNKKEGQNGKWGNQEKKSKRKTARVKGGNDTIKRDQP